MTADGRSTPDMSVAVGDYEPAWPDRFAEQRGALTELLAPWLAGPVQHVGSTAVPGLRTKPIVDMASVRSLPTPAQPLRFWTPTPMRMPTSWRRF